MRRVNVCKPLLYALHLAESSLGIPPRSPRAMALLLRSCGGDGELAMVAQLHIKFTTL